MDDDVTYPILGIITIPEHFLKSFALYSLCRLTFILEDFRNWPSVLGTEIPRSLLLGWQAQIVNLFLGGDATVDDGIRPCGFL